MRASSWDERAQDVDEQRNVGERARGKPMWARRSAGKSRHFVSDGPMNNKQR